MRVNGPWADAADSLVLLGVLLLGLALWMWLGAAAVVAYVGTVALVLGLALAVRK